MPKKDILALNAIEDYTYTVKFIWLILSAIRQMLFDIVLDTLEFCYF